MCSLLRRGSSDAHPLLCAVQRNHIKVLNYIISCSLVNTDHRTDCWICVIKQGLPLATSEYHPTEVRHYTGQVPLNVLRVNKICLPDASFVLTSQFEP